MLYGYSYCLAAGVKFQILSLKLLNASDGYLNGDGATSFFFLVEYLLLTKLTNAP